MVILPLDYFEKFEFTSLKCLQFGLALLGRDLSMTESFLGGVSNIPVVDFGYVVTFSLILRFTSGASLV